MKVTLLIPTLNEVVGMREIMPKVERRGESAEKRRQQPAGPACSHGQVFHPQQARANPDMCVLVIPRMRNERIETNTRNSRRQERLARGQPPSRDQMGHRDKHGVHNEKMRKNGPPVEPEQVEEKRVEMAIRNE